MITGILYSIAALPILYSSYLDCSPSGVLIIKLISLFFIASTIFGLPSPTLNIFRELIPLSLSNCDVPEVAIILKSSSLKSRAIFII